MKLILENWRQYLLTERYSIESGLAALKPTNKKMYNLFKRVINAHWHEDIAAGVLDPKWDPEPKVPEEEIRKAASGFRAHILDLIPQDIWGQHATTEAQRKKEADKNQGLAIMWIRKLSIENPKIAVNIIAGDVYHGIYNRVMPSLEIYFQNLDLMPKRNLMEIGSFEQLHDMVEAAKEKIEARRQSKFANINIIDDGTTFLSGGWNKEIPPAGVVDKMTPEEQRELLQDLETVPGGNGMVIMVIDNKAASCFHGTVDWCTAQPSLDYFEEYYEPDDPLFIFDRGGEKYQFHYGSEQFMDEGDRPVPDKLFKELHGTLIQTGAQQKYPVLQAYSYNLKADDPNTPPEELAEIAEELMSGDSDMSSSHTWSREVLAKIAKNSRTPIETLRMFSNSNDKYVLRALSVNQQLHQDDSPEGMKLAKEIFLNNVGDPLMFDRGLKQVDRWIKAGVMSKEEANKALKDHMEAEELRKKARKAAKPDRRHQAILRERKIKIRIKL